MRDTALPTNGSIAEPTDRSPYVIASALRTLQVLHAFGAHPEGLGLADVVARLGMERNQAYRSLKTLEAAGFVVQGEDSRFVLGPAASAIATAAATSQNPSLIDVAAPLLDRLSSETYETVHLFARSGDRAVCVDRRESTQSVRLVSVLGRSLPLHAGAVPKAILAALPADERKQVIERLGELPRYTDKTAADPTGLELELKEIERRGYSISDEDFDAAARGVGAAVFGADGKVAGGISVGGPSFRVNDAVLARFAQLVRAASEEITRRLALSGRS